MLSFFKRTASGTAQQPSIMLRNSATGALEPFTPHRDGVVTMYSCGPTVYDHAHIGNLRAFLLPDLLRRLFTDVGFTVKHTINFTDFGHLSDDGDAGEDKMMKALTRHKKPITLEAMRDVAQIYIDSFKSDFARFGNLPPTHWTPASAYVPEQIRLVKTLLEKGYAYETPDGVYFDVSAFPAYGMLGHIHLDKLREGARVEVNPWKRHPADFALWKKGLLGWESDWGKGFPGWHIECTAMVFATLGKQIDIHTGGEDLMYTHHNGEIAQAEAITRKQYVRYWMHNAHLSVDNEKIAKSLGNGITLPQVVARGYAGYDVRYLFLMSHYRSPMNFTWDALEAAKTARARLSRLASQDPAGATPHAATSAALRAALADDMNTPKALATLWTCMGDDMIPSNVKAATLRTADALLGIGLATTEETVAPVELTAEVRTLAEMRVEARKARNWSESDRLRDKMVELGFTVTDTPTGQRITRAQ